MTEVMEGQVDMFDLGLWSGKTYPEHSAATKAKTSAPSLKRSHGSKIKMPLFLDLRGGGDRADASWETDGASLGVYMTHSFGEFPREENASRLSQILEDSPHPKYYLSAKACSGILRRAERRGKELLPMLREALEAQSRSKSEEESPGGAKGS